MRRSNFCLSFFRFGRRWIFVVGKKIKDNRIEIRITEEEYEMLQEMKQEFGASSSDILRKGLKIQYDMYKYSNYSMR